MNRRRVGRKGLVLLVCMALMLSSVPVSAKSKASKKVNVKKVKVTSVMGSTKKAYVAKGKKVKLTGKVTVKPSKKTYQKLKWSVKGKKSVLSVSQKGIVKGKKKGTVKVKVTSRTNKKKSAVITVKVVPGVKSVKATKKTATIAVGGTTKMKVKVKGPKGCYKGVVYSSKNKKVAKVSRKGVITGVAEGTVKITATAADGTKKKASITVTVTPVGTEPGTNPSAAPSPTPNTPVESISIQSVTFLHAQRIRVALSKPMDLKKEDFDITLVSRVDGSRCKADIKKILTTDHQHYTINMTIGTYASNYDDYEVTISSLPGNGVKTMKNATRKIEEVKEYSHKLNDTTHSLWVRNNDTYYDGYRLVSAQNLPEGITIKEYPDDADYGIDIDGNASQNGVTSTLIFEGPYGMSRVEHITWEVAASGQLLITPFSPGGNHLSFAVGEEFDKVAGVSWIDGAGVELTNPHMEYVSGAPEGVTVTTFDNNRLEFVGTVNTPGTYPIQVRCKTDNARSDFTFYLEITPKTHLTMETKDLTGQACECSEEIYFYADDDFTKEPLEYYLYSGKLDQYVPMGTYTVYIKGQFFENVEIRGNEMEWNPVLELYRVKCVNSTPDVHGYFTASEGNHYFFGFDINTSDSEQYGYVDVYSPNKVYTGDVKSGMTVTHSATVRMLSMANGEISVELTASPVAQNSIDLSTVGEYKTINPMMPKETMFSFTPTETARYYLDIKNDHYIFPYISAYTGGSSIGYDFIYGKDCYYMRFSNELVAGQTYQIRTSFYSSNLNQSLSLAMIKGDPWND